MHALGAVFRRPKPIGITVGSTDSARGFGVTGVTDATGVTYNNVGLPWPGIWQVEMVGGGGGGGGMDSFYYLNSGAAGGRSEYTESLVTLGVRPISVRVGAGGIQGTVGASPTAGQNGYPSYYAVPGITSSGQGFGGQPGSKGNTRNPTPTASAWPYGTSNAGRGGRGATDSQTPQAGNAGALRFKLKG